MKPAAISVSFDDPHAMILKIWSRPGKLLVPCFPGIPFFAGENPLNRQKDSRCRDYSIANLGPRSACRVGSYTLWSLNYRGEGAPASCLWLKSASEPPPGRQISGSQMLARSQV